jgi:hypothetical protein
MGLRRQAWEWRNLVASGASASTRSHTGNPVNYEGGNTPVAVIPPFNTPIDIFIGGYGNNLDKPAELRATQFIIIDYISGWPMQAHLNIRINETRFFQTPDTVVQSGVPCGAVPFPDSNALNLYSFRGTGADKNIPPIYILPGQTWGIEWTYVSHDLNNIELPPATIYGNQTKISIPANRQYTPTTNDGVFKAYVKYLLVDGSDAVIAMQLLMEGIPICEETISAYKRSLIRSRLFADAALEETPMGVRRVI